MAEKKIEANSDTALYLAREKVLREMPEIIDEVIEKAKSGSYQHAKFLLEFAGNGGADPNPGRNEESLAALLLERLRESTTESEPAG